ncbi:MAG: T9SS type A sorting domain-containing protein [Flavobacteriaceae bacterium]
MKKNYFFGIVLLFSMQLSLAQFTDGFEWAQGGCSNHWYTSGEFECPNIIENIAHTGSQSGYLSFGIIDASLLEFGNQTTGQWGFEFWMNVVPGQESYFGLVGQVPIDWEEWVGNVFFNQDGLSPGDGLIDNTALGMVLFDYPEGEWFRVAMNFDFSSGIGNATWGMSIADELVIPEGTPLTNLDGEYLAGLGGLLFHQTLTSNIEFFIDDINLEPNFVQLILSLSTNDFSHTNVTLYPNPAGKLVNIECSDPIQEVVVYSQLGQKVHSLGSSTQIDVSNLDNGLYFVEVRTSKGKGFQKFIKE